MNILEHKRILAVVGASLTAASGLCLGYLYGLNEAEKAFDGALETLLDKEIEKTRRYYEIRYKDLEPEDVSHLRGEVVVDEQHIVVPHEALTTEEGRAAVMKGVAEAIEPEEEVPTQVNVFDPEAVPVVDIGELIANRSADKPYIISREEYLRNDVQYEQYDLTFFERDGVLISEDDDAIPDTENVVGDENLQRFGVMSENNNVVYIQNDGSGAQFRITRSFQTSSEALFGVDEEDESVINHSSMKRRRPRRDDE